MQHMRDVRDILDIAGRGGGGETPGGGGNSRKGAAIGRPWLSVWFNCCQTYARIYRNREKTAYEGRCPRCGCDVRARIGPGGTSRRTFETT